MAKPAGRKAPLPACSSDEIVKALAVLGFKGDQGDGSHMPLKRPRAEGGHDHTVVKMGEKRVTDGMLAGILRLGNISKEEFSAALGGPPKKKAPAKKRPTA